MTTTLEALKAQMAQAAQEMAAKKLELAEALKSLKEEQKKLADLEKQNKEEAKRAEAEARAKKMAEALKAGGAETKVNMTEEIRTRLLNGQDIDTIQKETGWNRKSILDRVWLIEKKLSIR